MKVKLRIIETENEVLVYDLDNPIIPVFTTTEFNDAVDYCYNAGENFEAELYEQILLDREMPFEGEE
jgi:hypothetical protein